MMPQTKKGRRAPPVTVTHETNQPRRAAEYAETQNQVKHRSRNVNQHNGFYLQLYRQKAQEIVGESCLRHEWPDSTVAYQQLSSNFRAEPIVLERNMKDPSIIPKERGKTTLQHLSHFIGSLKVQPWEYNFGSEGEVITVREEMPFSEFEAAVQNQGFILYLQLAGLKLNRDDKGPSKSLNEEEEKEESEDTCILSILGNKIQVPRCLHSSFIKQSNLWVGKCPTSNLHMDGLDNILCCIEGEKLIHLYSPWETLHLKPRGRTQLPIESSMKSFFNGDIQNCPDFFIANRYKATIRSGESLFIPAGWWHEVITPSPTVAVNFWVQNAQGVELRPSLMYLRSEEFYQFWLRQNKKEKEKQLIEDFDGCDKVEL